MTRQRICLITSGLAAGGSELQLTQLAVGLQRRGWPAHVISLQPGGIYREQLLNAGVPVTELGIGRVSSPASFARLVRAVRRAKPALVHTQAFRANLWGRMAALALGVPVVASVRATYSYLPGVYRPVERLLGLGTSYIVTPARASSRYLVSHMGIPAAKVVTIPNGVDTSLFSPAREGDSFRDEHGLQDRFVVFTAGRLVAQKNHALLLQAFEVFSARVPGAVLVIAGSGPLQQQIQKQAAPLGDQVRFVGELNRLEVATAIAGSDVICLLSDFEGTPNAVLEAMAGGKAVVATAVDGVPDVVRHGVEGLLVARGDAAGAAEALTTIARAPELRLALGRNGRRRIEAQHSIEVNVERHEVLYREIVNRCSWSAAERPRRDRVAGGSR